MVRGHNVEPCMHVSSCNLTECIIHVPGAPIDGGMSAILGLEPQESLCDSKAHFCGCCVDPLEENHGIIVAAGSAIVDGPPFLCCCFKDCKNVSMDARPLCQTLRPSREQNAKGPRSPCPVP